MITRVYCLDYRHPGCFRFCRCCHCCCFFVFIRMSFWRFVQILLFAWEVCFKWIQSVQFPGMWMRLSKTKNILIIWWKCLMQFDEINWFLFWYSSECSHIVNFFQTMNRAQQMSWAYLFDIFLIKISAIVWSTNYSYIFQIKLLTLNEV